MTEAAKVIPWAGPWITEKEIEYAAKAAKEGWYENATLFQRRFEEAFASYCGRRHALSTDCGTSAIFLALRGLGVGPGDEVIAPDVTWVASTAAITHLGATPIFVDIEEDSWCLSVDATANAINDKTSAIIAVDLYGALPRMEALLDLATARNIPVLEDAAEAQGARYRDRRAGSFGTISVSSFHGSKTLSTGEGGMLLTDDAELYKRCYALANHGRGPGDSAVAVNELAYKHKMSPLQAAVGLAQLERIDELVAKKRQIHAWYEALLAIPGLWLIPELADVFNGRWMPVLQWSASLDRRRDKVLADLAALGVTARAAFDPLSSTPAYEDSPPTKRARAINVNSYRVTTRAINLPSPLTLTESQADQVVDAVRSTFS